jgi:hypothetical protein
MGFPVPNNNPTFTINGGTYCVAAFDWDTPIGRGYYVGVFVRMNDGSWNSYSANNTNGVVVQYMNPDDVINAMKAKGGRVAYLNWLLAQINAILAKLFAGVVPPPSGEPTTDQQARDIISAYVFGLTTSGNPPQSK